MRALIFLCILSVSSTPLFSIFAQTPSSSPTQKSKQKTESAPSEAASTSPKSTKSRTKVRVEKIDPNQAKALDKAPTQGSEVYQQQIAQIEAQVNELKEEIFRSKTRLAILKETVLASGFSGTELKLIHRNEMGSNFKLKRVHYILDGQNLTPQILKGDTLDAKVEQVIFDGALSAGNHVLKVEMIYQGNGYGVFSYLKAYRFTLNEAQEFRLEEGKKLTLTVIGYELGGVETDLQERPNIRFDLTWTSLEQIDPTPTTSQP
jgi:hypothetical protein